MTGGWRPDSWRGRAAAQQPAWPDPCALAQVEAELSRLPPLVFAGECRRLTEALARVARGEAFLLQAGDCAESFDGFEAGRIRDMLKVFLQMAIVLTYSGGMPTVKVGRIAGQFAKPRSSDVERRGQVSLPSFRGHMVNDLPFTPEARVPDAGRLLRAYHQSAATLNLLRAFTKGGFAGLSQVHAWNQAFVAASAQGRRYEKMAEDIDRALRFMRACGADPERDQGLRDVDFYTSHEALVLHYEQALTRQDPHSGDWYDLSAHMLWIGERTRQLDQAHVEFLRGVHNPVGCKVGPDATAEDVLGLCELLNPARVPGRLTLVARMGAGRVRSALPPLLRAVRDAGHPVVWASDPMHGNTFTAEGGQKTRHFDEVLDEVSGFFAACHAEHVHPGGVHVELTGDAVTECLGGSDDIGQHELGERYETMCDPRLNARQSLDLAFRVAELLQ